MHIRYNIYVVRTYMGKVTIYLLKEYIYIYVQNNILHEYTHSFFFSIKFNMASFTAIPPPSNTPPPLKKNICATEDEEETLITTNVNNNNNNGKNIDDDTNVQKKRDNNTTNDSIKGGLSEKMPIMKNNNS